MEEAAPQPAAPHAAAPHPATRTNASGAPPLWKSVALPAEHGGWGLLIEPALLGLTLAWSIAGAAIVLATLLAFLARHPLRLAFMDRRRRVRYPRTRLAELCFLAYATGAVLFLAAALALTSHSFLLALAAGAPFAVAALGYDAQGRGREALAESCGAAALSTSAAAIGMAGGFAAMQAIAAASLLAVRALTSVLYVRARIRLDRGLAAGPRTALAAHATALALAVALILAGAAPRLAALAFLVLLLRAAYGLSRFRPPLRPQQLGFQELRYGILTLLLLAIGYRAGL